jgi:tRNA(Ile)-lysidine synthase
MSSASNDKHARFAAALAQLTVGNADGRIGFAVSGGPDSVAMLILAAQHLGASISAATVDHGLRPEAAQEAAFVAQFCAEKGIAHRILNVAAPITGNVQAGARAARYALLEQWANDTGCHWIATAHHANDQLETLLMRIARGAGISGLSGIRLKYGRIIRPLLGFTKAELEEICAEAGVVPCRDPSNSNLDFDRIKMRQWLSEKGMPIDPLAALRSTSALQQASEALEWTALRLLDERVSLQDGSIEIDASSIPAELQRRLLLLSLRKIDPAAAPRGELMDRALDTLKKGGKIMIGDVICRGGDRWHLAPAPPRKV